MLPTNVMLCMNVEYVKLFSEVWQILYYIKGTTAEKNIVRVVI